MTPGHKKNRHSEPSDFFNNNEGYSSEEAKTPTAGKGSRFGRHIQRVQTTVSPLRLTNEKD